MRILIIPTLFLCISCTRIVFTVPQPVDGAALDAFPQEIRGTYESPEDEVDSLVVEATLVTFYGKEEREISLEEIREAAYVKMENGKLYDLRFGQRQAVPYQQADSLITFALDTTLIFGLSDSFVLKRLDDRLVVNFRSAFQDKFYWDAILIQGKGKKLTIHTIGNVQAPGDTGKSRNYAAHVNDFAAIAPYTEVQEKTFLFEPSTAQFRSMVKEKLFSDKEVYKRIR